MLLAARCTDVAGIVTIGADLDLRYWTARDKLAPFAGSLDLVAFADQVSGVPQIHFVGMHDDVVGPNVARSYLSHMGDTSHARLVEIDGFSLDCCWADARQTYPVGSGHRVERALAQGCPH